MERRNFLKVIGGAIVAAVTVKPSAILSGLTHEAAVLPTVAPVLPIVQEAASSACVSFGIDYTLRTKKWAEALWSAHEKSDLFKMFNPNHVITIWEDESEEEPLN